VHSDSQLESSHLDQKNPGKDEFKHALNDVSKAFLANNSSSSDNGIVEKNISRDQVLEELFVPRDERTREILKGILL
jgi:hypothetical protein